MINMELDSMSLASEVWSKIQVGESNIQVVLETMGMERT